MKQNIRFVSIIEYDFSLKQFIDLGFVIDLYKLLEIFPYRKAATKAAKCKRGSAQISYKNSYSRGDAKVKKTIEKAIVKKEKIPKTKEIYVACLYFYVGSQKKE